MVIENQQISAVIDRRGIVFRDNPAAELLSFISVVGSHYHHGSAIGGSLPDQVESLLGRQIARRYTELPFRTIQAKGIVTAINTEILELHSSMQGDSAGSQRRQQLPVARQ